MKEWKQKLPPSLQAQSLNPDEVAYRAVAHIHLNYYYIWLTLGKTALVGVVRDHLRYNLTQPAVGKPPFDPSAERLSSECIRAGRKILHLLEDLVKNRSLGRFSFTDFHGCSIATIVTLLEGIIHRDSGYEARVTFGLECLRTMSIGNATAEMGVQFVEAFRSIANEAANKLSRSPGVQQQRSEASRAEDGYHEWTAWLAKASQERSSREASTFGTAIESRATAGSENDARQHNLDSINGPLRVAADESDGSNTELPSEALREAGVIPASLDTDASFFASWGNDDQSFLMGLTGLDVLDFTGLTMPFEQ